MRSSRLIAAAVGLLAVTATVATIVPATAVPPPSTASIALPPANGRFDYQLGGPYPPLASVRIVDRDSTARPAAGKYNICYINSFQTQADQRHFWATEHPQLLLQDDGALVQDPGWPGEFVLDTSTAAKRTRIANIEKGWFDACAAKGFQAIEPDNLDSWTRSHHLLTEADNLALAKLLITDAHADHLAIAQKNTAQLGNRGAKLGFDFAVAEECQVYSECGSYTKAYGNEVFEIEYTDNPIRYYRQACAARGKQISIVLRDRDVVPRGNPAYRYESC